MEWFPEGVSAPVDRARGVAIYSSDVEQAARCLKGTRVFNHWFSFQYRLDGGNSLVSKLKSPTLRSILLSSGEPQRRTRRKACRNNGKSPTRPQGYLSGARAVKGDEVAQERRRASFSGADEWQGPTAPAGGQHREKSIVGACGRGRWGVDTQDASVGA